jgi:hypothetical protein
VAVKKPKPSKARSYEADSENAGRGPEKPSSAFGPAIEVVDVAAVPIQDPFHEKSMADRDFGTLLYYLSRNTGYGKISAHALRSRIIEIYRRCYESSGHSEGVICDFVAAHPQLIFDADWLKVLIVTQAANGDFRPNGPRNRLFRAMATGLRRVANPTARITRSMRVAQMEAARFALRDIRKDLDDWERTLNRPTALPEWIDERANAKAAELAAHPRLEPHQQQLKELLYKGQHYKASIFVAANIYCVRPRALQSRKS